MFYYRLYDLKVASDIEFHQLVVCDDEKPADMEICEGMMPEDILSQENEGKYEFGQKRSWLINRTCYLLVENGCKLTYHLKPNGLIMYLQSYILGFGMSMIAMQRGMLSIHCSAVADDKGALLIAGESGAGKSTLTTAFLERGYRLMADDMAWVEAGKETVWARPAFPFQKLCRDVAISKGYDLSELLYINEEKDKFLAPYREEFRTDAIPVKGLIMLGVSGEDELVCKEVTGIQKFYVCANNLFLRHLLGDEKYDPEIGQKCLKVASGIPMYFIGRPPGKDTAAQVIEKAFKAVEDFNKQI